MKRSSVVVGMAVAGATAVVVAAGLFWAGGKKGWLSVGERERRDGEGLARVYCAGCHLFPEAGVLDKGSWSNGVLPEMGRYLGVLPHGHDGRPPGSYGRSPGEEEGGGGGGTNVYPKERLVSEEEWKRIVGYYVGAAPEVLRTVTGGPTDGDRERGVEVGKEGEGQFRVRRVAGYERKVAMTSMVKVLSGGTGRRGLLCVGDGMSRTLEVLRLARNGTVRNETGRKEGEDQRLVTSSATSRERALGVERVLGVEFDSGPIWLESYGGSASGGSLSGGAGSGGGFFLDVLTVGRLFPSDLERGRLVRVNVSGVGREGQGVEMETLLRGLRRPVHFARGDLNGDGVEDLVVCEFGNREGRLVCWLSGATEGHEGYGGSASGREAAGGGARPGTAGGFVEYVLLDRAGAIRSELRDMNGDGRLDVVALMGQAREGVYLFVNCYGGSPGGSQRLVTSSATSGGEGGQRLVSSAGANGGAGVVSSAATGGVVFRQEVLVEEHPAFGFSYFELVDFDGDGDLDLLTTNGDNGDSYPAGAGSPARAPHKPYHGVRIYLNSYGGSRGDSPKFTQRWFFRLHGAYGARVADFDLDGDLDVAAISYFPSSFGGQSLVTSTATSEGGGGSQRLVTSSATIRDGGSPGFVYLENRGGFEFKGSTIAEHGEGRWMVMDAGDLDGDGDVDVVLGSLVLGPTSVPIPAEVQERWRSNAPAVLVLENVALGK